MRETITALMKTASTLLTIPIETVNIGDQLRIRLLTGARTIESKLDRSKDVRIFFFDELSFCVCFFSLSFSCLLIVICRALVAVTVCF